MAVMFSYHDLHWHRHPAVPTGTELPFGDRAADWMKSAFGTWYAIFAILAWMLFWIISSGFGIDNPQLTILNLILSCLAALQCFILLIAQKRQDATQAALQITIHTLLEHNTQLTVEIHRLTDEVHRHLIPEGES